MLHYVSLQFMPCPEANHPEKNQATLGSPFKKGNCFPRTEAHYHCPNCSNTVLRRYVMEAHLQICSSLDVPRPSLASQPSKTPPAPVSVSTTSSQSTSQADDASINVLHPVMVDVLLESSQENQLMRDLKEASKWCSEQSSVLLGSVQLPKVLCMEDEDVDEAMDKLQKAQFSEDRIDALEPFCFIFTEKEDMILFLEHVVDVMNLKVFCQTETKENT
ncbi:uncharacterized protein LOC125246189 isoform X2 [Megalobrama amblycephala]|uniref:uncharacterized protein LOC125246189 isoform X2 n=1 Tax=Megalobrama amblycephala TaxID=75352 RepID=UPI0020144D2F|nr:uncharacterized protein LOC125246189 isoform X2 [Megalobrama amblycephala]